MQDLEALTNFPEFSRKLTNLPLKTVGLEAEFPVDFLSRFFSDMLIFGGLIFPPPHCGFVFGVEQGYQSHPKANTKMELNYLPIGKLGKSILNFVDFENIILPGCQIHEMLLHLERCRAT